MSNTLIIIGGIVLVGVAYYSYKRKKSKRAISKEEVINELASTLNPENVDKLSLSDVINYFKTLQLRKGIDTPFIAIAIKNGVKSYVLATYKEESNEIENGRLVSPKTIDDELIRVMGNETFVILS